MQCCYLFLSIFIAYRYLIVNLSVTKFVVRTVDSVPFPIDNHFDNYYFWWCWDFLETVCSAESEMFDLDLIIKVKEDKHFFYTLARQRKKARIIKLGI